jgi:hypothetical protein
MTKRGVSHNRIVILTKMLKHEQKKQIKNDLGHEINLPFNWEDFNLYFLPI